MSSSAMPSVHVNFNYSKRDKAGVHVFVEETLIFGHNDTDEERNATFAYIKRLMKKMPEYYIYVLRLDEMDHEHPGRSTCVKNNCLMFRHEPYNTDVVEVLGWSGAHYDQGQRYVSTSAAAQELWEAIETHRNWIYLD